MSSQTRISKAKPRTALVLLSLCLFGINGLAETNKSVATVTPGAQLQQPSPSPSPKQSAASAKTTQSEQGRQYGQPGFLGEPINLNVVNADIRDILNYITEQYGVNFVIDSSVGAVPVTSIVSVRPGSRSPHAVHGPH